MITFELEQWHSAYPDVLLGVLSTVDTKGVIVEVVPVSEVARVLGKTEQEIKDALTELDNPDGDEPPVGNAYANRWWIVVGPEGDVEVVTYSMLWYCTLNL